MKKFFEFLFLLICAILLTIYSAYVFSTAWNWLMVPVFHAEALTVLSALILVSIIRALVIPFQLTFFLSEENKDSTFTVRFTRQIYFFAFESVSLGMFYILKLFI
jgi:hypothetical protein